MANKPTGVSYATDTAAQTITINWTKGAGTSHTMVRYRTDGTSPTSTSDGTILYKGKGTQAVLYGIDTGTTYSFSLFGATSSFSVGSATTVTLTTGHVLGLTTTPQWIIVSTLDMDHTATGDKSTHIDWINRETLAIDATRQIDLGTEQQGPERVKTSVDFNGNYWMAVRKELLVLGRISDGAVVINTNFGSNEDDRARTCYINKAGTHVFRGGQDGYVDVWAIDTVLSDGDFLTGSRLDHFFPPGQLTTSNNEYIRDCDEYGNVLAVCYNSGDFYLLDASDYTNLSVSDQDADGEGATESVALTDTQLFTGAKDVNEFAQSDLTSIVRTLVNNSDDITSITVDDQDSHAYTFTTQDDTSSNAKLFNSSGTLLNTFTELNGTYAEDGKIDGHLGQLFYGGGQFNNVKKLVVRDYLDFTWSDSHTFNATTTSSGDSGGFLGRRAFRNVREDKKKKKRDPQVHVA